MKTSKGSFKKGMVPWNKGKHGVYSKELLEKMSKAGRGRKHSQETRKKMSETHKKISHKGHFKKGHVPWLTGTKGLVKANQGSFKKGQTSWNKGKRGVQIQSAETKLKRSRSMKGKNRGAKSKEAKRKMSLAKMGKKLSTEHKKNITNGLRTSKIVISPAYKEQQRQFRLHQVFPTKDSKPERILQKAFRLRGIKFEKHKAILGQPDLFIKPNICIFVDGVYWHSKPKQVEYDRRVNMKLSGDGYQVYRVTDKEVLADADKALKHILSFIKYHSKIKKR